MRNGYLALRAAVLSLCVAAVVVASGCGGSSGGNADADPASALPASPIYFQMQIGEGQERSDLGKLINKLAPGDQDVTKRIRDSLDKSLSDSGDKVSYDDDIKPWLGKDAAVSVSSFGAKPGVAVALASKDNGKAKDLLDKSKGDDKSYNGVDYKVSDGAAAGVVGDFVVIGTTEPDFKKAVDAGKGSSLADDKTFTDARSAAGADNLGFLYADPKGLLKLLQSVPGAAGQLGQLSQIPGFNSDRPVTAAIKADPSSLTVQAQAQATAAAKANAGKASVADLPADSFVALASGSAGTQFGDQLKTLPPAQRRVVDQQLKARTGLGLEGLIGWLDSFQLYVSGTSITDLGVGIELGSNNPAKSKRAVAALAKLARQQVNGQAKIKVSGAKVTISSPQVPQPVEIDGAGDTVKISYGKRGSGKLSDNAAFKSAVTKLNGGTPSFYIGGAPLAQLVGAAAAVNPRAGQAKQALDAFDYVIAGSKVEGGTSTATLVFAVK